MDHASNNSKLGGHAPAPYASGENAKQRSSIVVAVVVVVVVVVDVVVCCCCCCCCCCCRRRHWHCYQGQDVTIESKREQQPTIETTTKQQPTTIFDYGYNN